MREILGGKSGKDVDSRCRKRGSEKPWICWWDIVIQREFKKNGRKYEGIVLAVKSGPADINKDIVERFIQHAKEAERHGYKAYLVLTYGKHAFNVAEATLKAWNLSPKDYLLVGRDIFREFLGNPDYYERAINLMSSAGGNIDVFELMEEKIRELTEELKKRYGNNIVKLLKELS